MDRDTKIGIILIIIGICVPFATFPYLSGYAKDKGLIENLYQAGIQIKHYKQGETTSHPPGSIPKINRRTPDFSKLIPRAIPLRLFLAISVVLFYMGIMRIEAAKRRKAEKQERLLRTGTLD